MCILIDDLNGSQHYGNTIFVSTVLVRSLLKIQCNAHCNLLNLYCNRSMEEQFL